MDLKSIALTTGIAILFTLFIVFFIDAVYEMPKYESYCNYTYYPEPQKVMPQNCTIASNELAVQTCYQNKGESRFSYDRQGCIKEQSCDYCSKSYNKANENYTRIIFYLSALLAIIAIIVGLYLPQKIDPIASGLIFGGVLILLQGTVRVFAFGQLDKFVKVLVLGIELMLLIWLGYKKLLKK